MAEHTDLLDTSEPSSDEVHSVARCIATAVAPADGLTEVQASLLHELTKAFTGYEIDYHGLEPLDEDHLARVLERRGLEYRQRIVQHMVLGELVLRPLPTEVAERVQSFADALGVDDHFVRVARRYANGAFGVAWVDLRRNGFQAHFDESKLEPLHTDAAFEDPFDAAVEDPALAERWAAMAELPRGSLGCSVMEMYHDRGFAVPGSPGGASAFLAQHDFVHVIADYGTNLEGELETFALIGRADPEPKGFAWLATVVGLFETGYVHEQGFLQMDVRERHLQGAGMSARLADALRRGKAIAESFELDLFCVDYHELAPLPVEEVQERLRVPPKGDAAVEAGSPGVAELDGLSESQRKYFESLSTGDRAEGARRVL